MKRLRRIAVALLEEQKLSSGNISPPEEPPEDGGDDPSWDEDEFRKKFNLKIQEWTLSSPFGKKIQSMLMERLFSLKPKTRMQWQGKRDRGQLWVAPVWEFDAYDSEVESACLSILVKSDIWKVFGIQAGDVWQFLDRGDVLAVTIRSLVSAMAIRKYSGIGSDNRSILDRRATFESFEWVKQHNEEIIRRIEDKVKKYGLDDYQMQFLEIHEPHPPVQLRGYGNLTGEGLQVFGSIYYTWNLNYGSSRKRREAAERVPWKNFLHPDSLDDDPPDYSDYDDPEAWHESDTYFSIGHGGPGEDQPYVVWAWIDGRIETSIPGEGATHGTLWGHSVTDLTYKGRYEPGNGILSLVKPERFRHRKIPRVLLDSLERKFNPKKIVEF